MYSLVRGRPPLMRGSDDPGGRATPGASAASEMKLRPFSGRFCTCSSATTWPRPPVSVPNTEASPVTRTASWTPPNSSTKSTANGDEEAAAAIGAPVTLAARCGVTRRNAGLRERRALRIPDNPGEGPTGDLGRGIGDGESKQEGGNDGRNATGGDEVRHGRHCTSHLFVNQIDWNRI